MEIQRPFELTLETIASYVTAVSEQNTEWLKLSLSELSHADIAALLMELETDQAHYIFSLLPLQVGADVLSEFDDIERFAFLKKFSSEEIALWLAEMDSDDATDVLMKFSVRQREDIIERIPSESQASNILDLLRYDADVAGGLMAKEFIKANENWTVAQTIEEIRKQAETVDKFYSVYVVDDDDKLLGRVSIKKILLANDKVKVAELYDSHIVSVETYTEDKDVATLMQKYDLESVPVVNARGKLVGRITIDDVIDVITETAEEERQLMAGISSDVEEDDSVWALSKARLPWLVIGMVGGLFAAQITDLFSEDIKIITGLALFIPLIMATGGNVGVQSSSIIVQSLAARSVFNESLRQRLLKMLSVAIINGLVLAILVMVSVRLIFSDIPLSYTVSSALFCVVVLASFMGTITPLVLDRLNINPALASGPFITTANDLVGLAVYFSVAHIVYNLS